MKPVNEMSEQECRDEIARAKGWTIRLNEYGNAAWNKGHEWNGDPIPATIDAAHDSLPEGYWFWVNYCSIDGVETYVCQLVGKRIPDRIETRADSMRLAMLRASTAAHRAGKERANG